MVVPPKEVDEVTSKWVINLSDYDLSDHEESVLKPGLKFSVSPDKVLVDDMLTAVESAVRFVGHNTAEADEIRNKASDILQSAKPPKSNVTRDQRKAIKSLQSNKDIMVLPADKGRAVCVLNTTDYRNKAETLLSDTNT